jgi:hypothetical protein
MLAYRAPSMGSHGEWRALMARMGGGPTLGRNGIPYHSPRTGRTVAGAGRVRGRVRVLVTGVGTDNRSKGTDYWSKGTDNRSKGTDYWSKGTDNRSKGTDYWIKGTDCGRCWPSAWT